MGIDIGIAKKDREAIAKGLSKLLADTYTLYLKTHGFHWNITGPMFNTLHLMFETQYNTLWLALDTIAERIRALDVVAPGSGAQFTKLSTIKEETGVPEWKAMHALSTRCRVHTARALHFTQAQHVELDAFVDGGVEAGDDDQATVP